MSRQASTYHPSTFLERGVAVPFTAAALAGARARPAEREAIELVIPNLSGGRGAYVVSPSGIGALCRPTVHDLQLLDAMAALRSISPSSIRRAARAVASQGFAGRAAASAALASRETEDHAAVVTNFELLLRLVRQTEEAGAGGGAVLETSTPAELEVRAKRTIAQLAPRLGCSTEQVANALEEMAELFSPIGLGTRQDESRLVKAVTRLIAVRAELKAFAGNEEDGTAALVDMTVSTADVTLACASKAMRAARAKADSIKDLLRSWFVDSSALMKELARPEWLLDGWERVCLLWQTADTPLAQRTALEEIVALLPVIPREAGDWVGFSVEMEKTQPRTGRSVASRQDWRTGLMVMDLIERNEKLCAAAA